MLSRLPPAVLPFSVRNAAAHPGRYAVAHLRTMLIAYNGMNGIVLIGCDFLGRIVAGNGISRALPDLQGLNGFDVNASSRGQLRILQLCILAHSNSQLTAHIHHEISRRTLGQEAMEQHAQYVGWPRHRERGVPVRTSLLRELGLGVLANIATLLPTRAASRSISALESIAGALSTVPPLMLLAETSPFRGPPEILVPIDDTTQVKSDSMPSSAAHGPHVPFFAAAAAAAAYSGIKTNMPPPPPGAYYCSRREPSGGKSSITATFYVPHSVAALVIQLPEGTARSQWIGVEVLAAPRSSMDSSSIHLAVSYPSGAARWVPLGVISCEALVTSTGRSIARRVPLPRSPLAIALRLSFKGYFYGNAERKHGLALCAILAEATGPLVPRANSKSLQRLQSGEEGGAANAAERTTALFSDATATLHMLESWAVSTAAGTGKTANTAQQSADVLSASLRCLCSIVRATGSLSGVLRIVQVRYAVASGRLCRANRMGAPFGLRLKCHCCGQRMALYWPRSCQRCKIWLCKLQLSSHPPHYPAVMHACVGVDGSCIR